MLIYHKTNGVLYCTQVILGFGESDVTTTKKTLDKVHESHKEMVKKLQDNKDILVLGGTYLNAVYKGKFEPREKFLNYLIE